MRRSPIWALAALLPIIGAVIIATAPDTGGAPAWLPETDLVHLYWFAALAIVLLAQMTFFAMHAWRNPKVPRGHRVAWVVGILSFAIISTPVYWWLYAEPAT
jgi:hypothetical protein